MKVSDELEKPCKRYCKEVIERNPNKDNNEMGFFVTKFKMIITCFLELLLLVIMENFQLIRTQAAKIAD